MQQPRQEIGKKEKQTQQEVIDLFRGRMGYEYLGNWQKQDRQLGIERDLLLRHLQKHYPLSLADKAVSKLELAAGNMADGLLAANERVYGMLRYGVSVRPDMGEAKVQVHFIDWKQPQANHFGIAEEVTVRYRNDTRRPDLVLYVNGIALGSIELKRVTVEGNEGIRQHIRNQEKDYIPRFFTTQQLLLAGNESKGLRYGTVGSAQKFYLQWKEESELSFKNSLFQHLYQLCRPERLLELLHDFIIFDKGIKKLCRPNQYFGIKAAQQRIRERQGGILWHTQGSGKSLTMVWLSRWVREQYADARVLIITDREELDSQIEGLFKDTKEGIHRSKSGAHLIEMLQQSDKRLMCSLVHKFGRHSEAESYKQYVEDLVKALPRNFKAKGAVYVFVDECHRTQSGKLHEAMKAILPDALFIGFTGTPLLKKDKKRSIEIFGDYIGQPYRFDEAVADGVVLDLLYEARDVEQYIHDKKGVDEWFERETKGLTDEHKEQLRKRWASMRKLLSSKGRLRKIVWDIMNDFQSRPRLRTGAGNALLVTSSVYDACRYYAIFQAEGFTKCAIITSYKPDKSQNKNEYTGDERPTEQLKKFEIYQRMLDGRSPEAFEEWAKEQFIERPSEMKLLIVVDKLLTGFDAPAATYLYVDKKMQDHGLFQAICRVNRLDEGKMYGYIIDYKDLFHSLKQSIEDYTSGAFDAYDAEDVKNLLKDRFEQARMDLDIYLEQVEALLEKVYPRTDEAYGRYFCGESSKAGDIEERRELREQLYKSVASLLRVYGESQKELHKLGYSDAEADRIRERVRRYGQIRDAVKQRSGDFVDVKSYEAGMRQLIDMYVDAKHSKKLARLKNTGLVEFIKAVSEPAKGYESEAPSQEQVAETIENNVRRVIQERNESNPIYYEKMSEALDELIRQRREEALNYKELLEKYLALANQVAGKGRQVSYPPSLNTSELRALYDNLGRDEALALQLDAVIRKNKPFGWRENKPKERQLAEAIYEVLQDIKQTNALMKIIKNQPDY